MAYKISVIVINFINNTIFYRTLHGQDQREKWALNVIKHTFQANSALLTTKTDVTVRPHRVLKLFNKAHIAQYVLSCTPVQKIS